MNYLHTDEPYPRGEICMKGASVFAGYFCRPDKTAECMEEDNWFRSGDIGMVYPNGTIKIIDRSKNIFKLSQGEYIAPEKMENIFVMSSFIEQCFVYGDSLKNACVAVIVPTQQAINTFSQAHGANWTENLGVKTEILGDMRRLALGSNCSSLEMPKKIYITVDPFSVDNDILTPTFKLKRRNAQQVYQLQID